MTDKPRAKCPVCGKRGMRKISGGAGLVFKGSGFYITDYGKDGKGPRPEKDAEPKAEAAAAAEAGGSAPAEKPESAAKDAKAAEGEDKKKKSPKKKASS